MSHEQTQPHELNPNYLDEFFAKLDNHCKNRGRSSFNLVSCLEKLRTLNDTVALENIANIVHFCDREKISWVILIEMLHTLLKQENVGELTTRLLDVNVLSKLKTLQTELFDLNFDTHEIKKISNAIVLYPHPLEAIKVLSGEGKLSLLKDLGEDLGIYGEIYSTRPVDLDQIMSFLKRDDIIAVANELKQLILDIKNIELEYPAMLIRRTLEEIITQPNAAEIAKKLHVGITVGLKKKIANDEKKPYVKRYLTYIVGKYDYALEKDKKSTNESYLRKLLKILTATAIDEKKENMLLSGKDDPLEEVADIISMARAEGDLLNWGEGILSLSPHTNFLRLNRIMEGLKADGLLKSSQKLVDLGSGDGVVLLRFAWEGLDTYGIELDQKPYAVYEEVRRSFVESFIQFKGSYHAVRGNFLPGKPDSVDEINGAKLKDMDWFYIYPWTNKEGDYNPRKIVEFILSVAKQGAKVLIDCEGTKAANDDFYKNLNVKITKYGEAKDGKQWLILEMIGNESVESI